MQEGMRAQAHLPVHTAPELRRQPVIRVAYYNYITYSTLTHSSGAV